MPRFVRESELNERSKRLVGKIDHRLPPARVVFYPCPSASFLFLAISRCGSTSVKTAILQQMGRLPGGIYEVHDELGYQPNGSTCISPVDMTEPPFDGYTSFAIYRDPIDRFRSIRRWYLTHGSMRGRWQGLTDEPGPYDYDFLIDLAKAELSAQRIEAIDEHLRPQLLYHQLVPPLDWIVPLDRLTRFMEQVLGVDVPQRHTTTLVEDHAPDAAQEAEIRMLYADDFLIPTWFSDRMYAP
jgi:hypothetical protein